MAIFKFDPDFSKNKAVIYCKNKVELIESLYHQLYIKIEDLKILPNSEEENYIVVMIAPYRERLMLGYVNERLE